MLVRALGTMLAAALAMLAVIDPVLGIAAAATIALAVGFFQSATFGVCAFFACTYLEIVTEYTGSPALSPVKVCGGALMLIAVLELATRSRHGSRKPAPSWFGHPIIVAAMVGYVVVGVASISWAIDEEQVRTLTTRLATEVLAFLAIGTFLLRRSQLRLVAGTVLFAGVASTFIGLLLGAQEFGRMVGTFTDPNEYAAAMVASVGFGYGALGAARTPWGRRMCVVGMLVCAWGVLESQSRGGLVALALAGMWIVLSSRGRERVRLMGVSFMLVAAGVSVLMLTPTGQQSLQRITNGDSSGRSDLWRIAVLEFQSAPSHGVGLGNFPVLAPRFVTEKTEHTELVNSVAPRTTHNSYLEIAAELGIFGLVTFGTFAFGCVLLGMRGVRIARRLGDPGAVRLGRGVVAAAIGLLGACLFLSNHYSELLWATLAACVSFFAYATRQERMARAIETAHEIVENLPIDEVDVDLSEALAIEALDELDTLPELAPRA